MKSPVDIEEPPLLIGTVHILPFLPFQYILALVSGFHMPEISGFDAVILVYNLKS